MIGQITSPGLVCALLQRLGPDTSEKPSRRDFKDLHDFTDFARNWVANQPAFDWARLPIVGRNDQTIKHEAFFADTVRVAPGPVSFFWGRVPIDRLVDFLFEFRGWSSDHLYVDLGSPLRLASGGSSFQQDCARRLARSALGQVKVGAAIVDLGEEAAGTAPDDFGRKLHHAVASNIKLSDHAEQVLSVLLDQLDTKKVLGDTKVSCALVRPPASALSPNKGPLEQINAVEMLDAVTALEKQLAKETVPTIVNMSLGTHIGPHNGDSPLEEFIAQHLFSANKRFVVVSAGNDGCRGVAAKRKLLAGEPDYLRVRTSDRCQELLIEFWWDHSKAPHFEVEATVIQPQSRHASASRLATITVGSATAGVLTKVPAGLPQGLLSHALFSGKCRKNLGCIAFSLSSTALASGAAATPMPGLDIRFSLKSPVDIVVNSWIVLAEEDATTAFLEGGPDGTIMVPATDASVVSVAGEEVTHDLWLHSSRGPAAEYGSGAAGSSPMMAHFVELTGAAPGTSFASPRAAADMAAVLADPVRHAKCSKPLELLCETYNLKAGALPTWSPRMGYYKVP